MMGTEGMEGMVHGLRWRTWCMQAPSQLISLRDETRRVICRFKGIGGLANLEVVVDSLHGSVKRTLALEFLINLLIN